MSNSQWFKKVLTIVMAFMVSLGCLPQLFIQALAEGGTYTIRFHANYTDDHGYHNGSGGGEIQVNAGDSIGETSLLYPTFDGGEIQYWSDSSDWYNLSGNNAYQGANFYTPEEVKDIVPTSDIDFYAHYAYNVTVDYAGGIDSLGRTSTIITVPEFQSYDTNQLEIPSYNIDGGHFFTGWSIPSSGIVDYFEPSNYDKTITAVWSDSYVVTLNANGGTFSNGNSTLTGKVPPNNSYNSFIGFELPTYSGHILNGWTLDNGAYYSLEDMNSWYQVCGDTTFTASWSSGTNVILDANGGTFSNGQTRYNYGYSSNGCYTWDFPQPYDNVNHRSFVGWAWDNGDTLNEGDWYSFQEGTVLYAQWVDSYVITLDANGGYFYDPMSTDNDPTNTQTVTYVRPGDAINSNWTAKINEPGKVLGGWSLEPDGDLFLDNEDGIRNYCPEGNMTLYAVWVDAYVVTLDGNGGTIDQNGAAQYDINVAPGNHVDELYFATNHNDDNLKLAGWSFTSNGGIDIGKWQLNRFYPDSSVTLYAVWQPVMKITLNALNGTMYNDWDQYGSSYTFDVWPANEAQISVNVTPPSSNLGFLGWSYTEGGEVDITNDDLYDFLPTGDMTLYAVYKTVYTATFHSGTDGYFYERYNENTGRDEYIREIERSVTENGYYTASIDIPNGINCYFRGWSLNPDGSGEVFDSYQLQHAMQYDSDKNFYAVYDDGTSVIFDYNGGYDGSDDSSYSILRQNNTYISPWDAPTELYYPGGTKAFVGWSTSQTEFINAFEKTYDASGSENEQYYLTGDVTLYAWWEPGYTATFHTGENGYYDVYNEDTDQFEHITEKTYMAPKNGYLSSWIEEPQAIDCFFVGWSLNADGSGELYDMFQIREVVQFDTDKDFYAVYDPGYTLTFDFNGGYDSDSNTSMSMKWRKNTYLYLEQTPQEVTYPEGIKALAGWSTSQTDQTNLFERTYDGSDYSGGNINVTGDMTLYAVWEDGYTLTFHTGENGYFDVEYDYNLNDHIYITEKTYNVVQGSCLYMDLSDPITSNNFFFTGWSKNADGSGELYSTYQASHYLQINENTNLYAVYAPGAYLTLDYNGGIDESGSNAIVFGRRKGYYLFADEFDSYVNDYGITYPGGSKSFAGWSLSPTEYVKVFDDDYDDPSFSEARYQLNGDVIFYAWWENNGAEEVTITFDYNGGIDSNNFTSRTYTYAKGTNLKEFYSPISIYRDGKSILGWSTNPNSYVPAFQHNESDDNSYYQCNEDATIYAIYGVHIEFNGNGGYVEASSPIPYPGAAGDGNIYVYYHANKPISALANYISVCNDNEEAVFAGWNTKADGTGEYIDITSDYTVAEDITLFAQWMDDDAIIITKQPEDIYAGDGETVVLSVEAQGSDLTYTWYFRNKGKTSWSRSTETSPQYTMEMSEARDGRQMYCIVGNASGKTVTSETATFHFLSGPVITSQPEDVYAIDGEQTIVSVEALGSNLTYTWYFRNAGKTAWSKSSETSSQYRMEMSAARDGRQTYCVVKDSAGNTAESNVATYHLMVPLEITSQPIDATVVENNTATFSISATGEDLAYQWQYLENGAAEWADSTLPGNDTDTITVFVTADKSGQQYRCVVTDKYGETATSDAATLTVVNAVAITGEPEDVYAYDGEQTVVSVGAEGEGLTYTWYYRNAGKTAWSKSSETSSQYRMEMSAARDGRQTYCVVRDAGGNSVRSRTVTYHLEIVFEITQQPEDVHATSGEQTVVSVEATGRGLTYTWYFRNRGKTAWSKSSETSSRYIMEMTEARDGRQTYCVVKDSSGDTIESNIVTYHLEIPLEITSQPEDVYAYDGEQTVVSVGAQGKGLKYTWYFRNAGKTAWSKSSETSSQYRMEMSAARDGRQTYCVVKDSAGKTVKSAIATYHIKTAQE